MDHLLQCLMCCSVSSRVVGGAVLEDGDGTDLAQVYNPKTSVWTEVAPMQIARSGSAACTLKGKIYVIGIQPYQTSIQFHIFNHIKQAFSSMSTSA